MAAASRHFTRPRPFAPIFATAPHRTIKFKYVTTIFFEVPAESWAHREFSPDAVYKPDFNVVLGTATYSGASTKSHQPHGWDQWTPIYDLEWTKSCSIVVDVVSTTQHGADPASFVWNLQLMNKDRLAQLDAVVADAAGGTVADKQLEMSHLPHRRAWPTRESGSVKRMSKHWDYRKWHGPRVAAERGYQTSTLTTYAVPFEDEIDGSTGVHYKQPLFVISCLQPQGNQSVSTTAVAFRVTLIYTVLMKHSNIHLGS